MESGVWNGRIGRCDCPFCQGKAEYMKQVSVLYVGVCGYGGGYLREFSEVRPEGVKIAGIVEVRDGVGEMFPIIREENIPVCKSADDFYKEHRADLAVISTPIHLHYQQTLDCIRHGSDVLIEKPVCTSVDDAKRLVKAAREYGRFVAVGYQLNYSRDVLAMKRDILSGKFGRPLSMKCLHACRRGEIYYHRNNWAGKISEHGRTVNDSPFNNACAHQFQLMTFLLGGTPDSSVELADVKGEVYRGNPGVENFDVAAVHALTATGVPIYYYTGHPCRQKDIGPEAQYDFENGTIYFGHDFGEGPKAEYVYRGKDGQIIDYGKVPKGAKLQKFYDAVQAVRDRTQPVCTVQCAIPHLEAVEALSKLPIRDIPQEQVDVVREGGDTYHEVKHFKEILEKCYENQLMPSEVTDSWGK
jgi:predicted dehydrogenase